MKWASWTRRRPSSELALKEDPQNQAARYYLDLVGEARLG